MAHLNNYSRCFMDSAHGFYGKSIELKYHHGGVKCKVSGYKSKYEDLTKTTEDYVSNYAKTQSSLSKEVISTLKAKLISELNATGKKQVKDKYRKKLEHNIAVLNDTEERLKKEKAAQMKDLIDTLKPEMNGDMILSFIDDYASMLKNGLPETQCDIINSKRFLLPIALAFGLISRGENAQEAKKFLTLVSELLPSIFKTEEGAKEFIDTYSAAETHLIYIEKKGTKELIPLMEGVISKLYLKSIEKQSVNATLFGQIPSELFNQIKNYPPPQK